MYGVSPPANQFRISRKVSIEGSVRSLAGRYTIRHWTRPIDGLLCAAVAARPRLNANLTSQR
jgi:hypothetical protein